ncbi:MAG: hypothetical protein DRH24_19575 [Deltaproteobacteria bacterium]|nr:MAG: hypothetical protein DRH24_19575 [Deltaproteobacteria bacterium]
MRSEKEYNNRNDREEKIDILLEEIKRQYNEIKEGRDKITNTGVTILMAIVLFMATNLFDMKIPPYNNYTWCIWIIVYLCTILCLLISLYHIFMCLTLEPKPIGVDIDKLVKGFDENKTKLELKETIVTNLRDSLKDQERYSRKKAKYYKGALFFLVIGFILFTIIKLSMLCSY